MRKSLLFVVLVLVLAGFNWGVVQKERLLANGRVVLFALAPVDPRALLMGDYMTLEYTVNRDIQAALRAKYGAAWYRFKPEVSAQWPSGGNAVVRIAGAGDTSPPGTAAFVRLDDKTPLGPEEALLLFRVRGRDVLTASTAFYFQEGHGRAFEGAVYGKFRLAGDGSSLLVALCDKEGNDIAKQRD